MLLEKIQSPDDVKRLSRDELKTLAAEVRTHLIAKLSAHGGHCGPNLGMVEATIALHVVFRSPEDKIVFDVSHQSYVHKMLTGRVSAFTEAAHYDDVSGYTEPSESEHDHFIMAHLHFGEPRRRTGQGARPRGRKGERDSRDRRRLAERRRGP